MLIRRALLCSFALLVPLVAVGRLPGPSAVQAAPGDPIQPIAGTRTIAGHERTTCVILETGGVQCWGEGGNGQIGDGGAVDRNRPTTVTGLADVIDVSTGEGTSCAVTGSFELWCWGSDSNGELGNGPASSAQGLVPALVPGMTGTVDVSTSNDHVCAVKANGTVWCWGEGDQHELANGSTNDEESPFNVPGISDARAVATAEAGSCVLHGDGTVSCWGSNDDGEVGDGTTDEALAPVKVPGVADAIDLEKIHASSSVMTCALIADGTISCWGDSEADWLDEATSPVAIAGIDDAVALRLGPKTICVVRADDSLWCAGDDDDVLPNDHPDDRETLDPTGITSVADAVLGDDHGCVVLVDGVVQCWGRNGRSTALGFGAASEHDPLPVPTIVGATAVDAGERTTCAIASGELWCWGRNDERLIADTDDDIIATPTRVGIADDLVDVSLGEGHGCVLNADDRLACWGDNFDGQLGTGDTVDATTPTPVAGSFTAVSAGRYHTCAIRLNQAAACWGRNSDGQLGNGTTNNTDVLEPETIVDAGIDFTTIAAGLDHTCGTQVNGRTRCWGEGEDGQLGDGLATGTGTPVLVDDLTFDFEAVTAGNEVTCAIRASALSCWGRGYAVEGLSSTDQRDTPDDKTIAGTWSAIDTEEDHACAIRATDGAVHCWGLYFDLRLTSASGSAITEPIAAVGVGPAIDITAGYAHSCSVASGGKVWCWGANDYGQSGRPSQFEEPQTLTLAGPALVEVEAAPPTTMPPTSTPPTTTPMPPADPELFASVDPARILETRSGPGLTTVDGLMKGIGRHGAGVERTLEVAGRADVPDDAVAAVLNITAIRPSGVGFVTTHPCVSPRPLTSSLNYAAETNLGNELIAALDADGDVCLYSSTDIDLAVDVVAYLPAAAGYRSTDPARLVDTRSVAGAETIDGLFEGDGRLAADTEYRVQVSGRGGIDQNATAAVVNITAVRAAGVGFLTVHPCVSPRPTAAVLNYTSTVNRGNEIIAPLTADGEICVYTSADTDVTVDAVGDVDSNRYEAVVPARFLDTRPNDSAIGGATEDDGRRPPGSTTELLIAGRGDVPAGAATATLNVTAVGPSGVGFVTVHPCLPTTPLASSLNYTAGVNGGNEIVAQLDADGKVCLYSSGDTHLTVDAAGYAL